MSAPRNGAEAWGRLHAREATFAPPRAPSLANGAPQPLPTSLDEGIALLRDNLATTTEPAARARMEGEIRRLSRLAGGDAS